jgi:hypothetical protein
MGYFIINQSTNNNNNNNKIINYCKDEKTYIVKVNSVQIQIKIDVHNLL